MKSCLRPLKHASHGALLALALAAATVLPGCAVIAVADAAATVAVGAVGLAADAVIGTARMVMPADDKKDKK